MIRKFFLYINTIRYLKPIQIYGRIYSKIKSKVPKNYSAPKKLTPNLNFKTDFIQHDPWNNRNAILNGEFCFLNKRKYLSFPPKWNPEADLLWKFNLHYFHYLFLLNTDEKEKIIIDWIEKNPIGIGTSWHPYVISLRLVNWIREDFQNHAIIQSIYIQAEYLFRNLEFYHPANHYLENARALIFAGIAFNESREGKRWLQKGKEIYYKELPRQVLEDDCYFEKSPMYHNIILHGLLDLLNILNEEDEFYLFIKDYAEKMLQFANILSFSNGNIPLFNDSTHEIAASINSLNNYYSRICHSNEFAISSIRQFAKLSSSGYFICKKNEVELIADFGCLGPDLILAHAHADIFTYELYYKGLPFIIDTGVYEYKNGEMRDFCRSTKAHNTISIDGKDQAEIWGGFRIGKRYQPDNVELTETDSKKILSGEFMGWSKLIGDNLIHKRVFETAANYVKVIDEVNGKGKHLLESFIHLHPDVEIKADSSKIELKNGNEVLELEIVNGKYSIETGFFFPEFGKKIENKVIRLYSNRVPCKFQNSFKII